MKIHPLCLGNLLRDFSVNSMKKTSLNGCVYNFSVSHNTSDIIDLTNIHKYFMKKHDINPFMIEADII